MIVLIPKGSYSFLAKMKWSKYQLAIFDAYENTNKNIVIDATAGAGKSLTLKELCNRTPENKSCLFMAFNKSIAEELRSKLPYYVDCSHS
jgi:superfamily II DNA or RNA helicase